MKNLPKKIRKWLATSKLMTIPRRIVISTISNINGFLIFFSDPERAKVVSLIRSIKKENKLLMRYDEAYQLFIAVKRTGKIAGDIAEVGAYKGASAKLICEAKGNKTLHLFDTFEGLPDLSNADNSKQFYEGQYNGAFEDVKNYLKKYPRVRIYKGLFPSTAEPIKNNNFSLVNLDVDIYESTLNCLKLFYPRMSKGGIIISHDYVNAPGVRKAFDDFLKNKPEPIIELSGSQCLIMKL